MNTKICFTLVLFTALGQFSAHGQTTKKMTPTQYILGKVGEQVGSAMLVAAPKKTLTAVTPPAVKKFVDVAITNKELDKAGIKVSFANSNLQMTGSVPGACADSISFLEPVKESPEDENKDADILNLDDLNKHSTRYGVRLSFKASDDQKSFESCFDAHKSDLDRVDLSTRSTLGKSILESNEVALAGFVDSEGKVVLNKDAAKSEAYQYLLSKIEPKKDKKLKHCVSCDIKEWNKMLALNIGGINALIEASIQAKISEEDELIKNAKSIKDLEKIRGELKEYVNFVAKLSDDSMKKDSLATIIATQYDSLLTKANILAFGDSQRKAGKYADFIASTYAEIADLPGIKTESKEEAIRLSHEFSTGGFSRVSFLSSIDPANEEVRGVLNGGEGSLRRLAREVNRTCSYVVSESTYARCNAAKQTYNRTYNQLQTLAKRFIDNQKVVAQFQAPLQGQAMTGFKGNIAPSAVPMMNSSNPSSVSYNQFTGNNLYQQNAPFSQNNSYTGASNLYQVSNTPWQSTRNVNAYNTNNVARPNTAPNTAVAIPVNLDYSAQNGSLSSGSSTWENTESSGSFMAGFNFSNSNS